MPGTEELLRLAGTTSAMIVPLATRGERIGAIFLGSGGRALHLDEWGAFVRTIGAQLAQAISLSRVFARLASSETRYRTLMENANDGVYVVSPQGTILEANASADELHRVPRGALIGRHIHETLAPESQQWSCCAQTAAGSSSTSLLGWSSGPGSGRRAGEDACS